MSIEQYAKFISEQLKANQHSTLRSGEVIMENADHKKMKRHFNKMSRNPMWEHIPIKGNNKLLGTSDEGPVYVGQHDDKHSETTFNHDDDDYHEMEFKEVHDEVKKQNPHLSYTEGHATAKAIHTHLKDQKPEED